MAVLFSVNSDAYTANQRKKLAVKPQNGPARPGAIFVENASGVRLMGLKIGAYECEFVDGATGPLMTSFNNLPNAQGWDLSLTFDEAYDSIVPEADTTTGVEFDFLDTGGAVTPVVVVFWKP